MPLSAAKQNELRQREALLEFESVKRWFTCETIRARSTKRGYLKYLAILVNRLNCTPDELVQQRIADMAQGDFAKRERLEQLVRELKREVSGEGKSKACMFVAAICSFMKANTGARLNINNPLAEITQEAWMYEGEPTSARSSKVVSLQTEKRGRFENTPSESFSAPSWRPRRFRSIVPAGLRRL